jgi:hypothetical protein
MTTYINTGVYINNVCYEARVVGTCMRDIVYIMRSWHREPAGVIEHFIFSLPRHISLHRFSFESFRMMTVIFEVQIKSLINCSSIFGKSCTSSLRHFRDDAY